MARHLGRLERDQTWRIFCGKDSETEYSLVTVVPQVHRPRIIHESPTEPVLANQVHIDASKIFKAFA